MSPGVPAPTAARVLRVITRLNIGGPAIQAIRLSTELRPAGFETRLVHGRIGEGEGDMAYLLPAEGLDVRFLATLQRPIAPWSDLRAAVALYRLMCEFRPQILHTHMAKAGLLGRAAAAAFNFTHPGSRTRVVHTYHGHVLEGYFPQTTTSIVIQAERALARACDVLIAVSARVRDELVDRYRIGSRQQFRVVPLGLDLDEFGTIDDDARQRARRELAIPAGTPVVTTVGRLTAIKHQTLFLETAQLVSHRLDNAVFLIAGGGELRDRLEVEAGQRGIADRVRFLGWRRDLATIYAASDVFLLTSRNEGTPVALIEAMAAGVPGVATDVGGVRDVITDPSCGIIAPFGDAAALAGGVCHLLEAPTDYTQIASAARAAVLARFRFARLATDLAALYRGLVEPAPATPLRRS